MMALRNIAKEVGVMPIATTGDSQKNQSTFNNFATYDISYTGQINQRQQLAEFFKNKAYEQIGITPQQLGAPNKYTNEEGIKTSQNAAYAQTAEIYQNFSEYTQRTLDLHLSVAQYAQGEGKDIMLAYTKSDASKAFLQFEDENFQLRNIGLVASADNKKKKELLQLKEALLNNNTLGSDILEISEIIKSDSYSELVEIARIANKRKQAAQQEEFNRQSQLNQQSAQIAEEQSQRDWEREETSKERDRETRIQAERIQALGRASDKESDAEGFSQINKEADLAIKSRQIDAKEKIDVAKMHNKEVEHTKQSEFKMKELTLRAKELEEKIKQRKSKEFTSIINKN